MGRLGSAGLWRQQMSRRMPRLRSIVERALGRSKRCQRVLSRGSRLRSTPGLAVCRGHVNVLCLVMVRGNHPHRARKGQPATHQRCQAPARPRHSTRLMNGQRRSKSVPVPAQHVLRHNQRGVALEGAERRRILLRCSGQRRVRLQRALQSACPAGWQFMQVVRNQVFVCEGLHRSSFVNGDGARTGPALLADGASSRRNLETARKIVWRAEFAVMPRASAITPTGCSSR